MTASDDPSKEAARREHGDRLRREASIAAVRDGIRQRGGSGMRSAIVAFLGPYLLWAVLRAANHSWTTPTVGKSIVSFFFGSGIPFASYTAWMLFLGLGHHGGGPPLDTPSPLVRCPEGVDG
jgi:hypothetical protein